MLNNHQQILELIKKSNNILITFPGDKNGEATAAALALSLALSKINKNSDILTKSDKNNNHLQKSISVFSFLPSFEKIKTDPNSLQQFVISLDTSQASVKHIKYKMGNHSLKFLITPQTGSFTKEDVSTSTNAANYDLIITLNTQDLESLEEIYEANTEFFYNTPIINIDNHSGNEEFGAINSVELTATSTTEILYPLLKEGFGDVIDEDIATCLLAGIIYKTKSFKTLNITPQALQTTSQLISLGARREEIIDDLYRSKNLNTLKLWGRIMARLSRTGDNKLVWSTLFHNDFIRTDSNKKELPDILDELKLSIPHAEILIIFYEDPEDEPIYQTPKNEEEEQTSYHPTHVLVHASKNMDLLELLKEYEPQGHEKLIEVTKNMPIQETKKEIINHLQQKLQQLSL